MKILMLIGLIGVFALSSAFANGPTSSLSTENEAEDVGIFQTDTDETMDRLDERQRMEEEDFVREKEEEGYKTKTESTEKKIN